MKENENGQRRAKAGGEMGVNGEWYEGGKFIASNPNRSKSSDYRPRDPAAAARAEAYRKANEEREAKLRAWVNERRAKFAKVLEVLLQPDGLDQWEWRVNIGRAGFAASLGQQLRDSGSLSPKQAEYAAKFVFGRKKNADADEWEALVADLSQDAPEGVWGQVVEVSPEVL